MSDKKEEKKLTNAELKKTENDVILTDAEENPNQEIPLNELNEEEQQVGERSVIASKSHGH